MNRPRNPRSAPESPERRPIPSALIEIATALVGSVTTLDVSPGPEPPDGDGDPPDTLPTIPVGPSLPAASPGEGSGP